MVEVVTEQGLSACDVCEEWLAYSSGHGSCELTEETCERWAGHLSVLSQKPPTNGVARKQRKNVAKVHTMDNLEEM